MSASFSEEAIKTTLFTRVVFSQGPQVWSCKNDILVPHVIETGDSSISGEELLNQAIAAKRKGDYETAIICYNILIGASNSTLHTVSTGLIRGLFKVFVCANAFYSAFTLICTPTADVQTLVNSGKYVDKEEFMLLWDCFNGLKALAKEVVDQGDLSSVMPYCANYSGTPLYRLPTSNEEIRSELKMVREEIRKFEG